MSARNANEEARALGWDSAHDAQNTIRRQAAKEAEVRARFARPVRHAIRIPSGRRVTVRAYVSAWRSLARLERQGKNPVVPVGQWDSYDGVPAMNVLRAMRAGMHDRINRYLPDYGHGRKWQDQYQRDLRLAARDLNTPNLRVAWLPPDLRRRFADRMNRHFED